MTEHTWPEETAAAAVVDAEAGNVLFSSPNPVEAEAFLLDSIDEHPELVRDLALVFFDKDGYALQGRSAEEVRHQPA